MQLQTTAILAAIRSFSSPVRCPYCGDWMVAPVVSEFVEDSEIRHHWECDACGGVLHHRHPAHEPLTAKTRE